MPERIRCPTEVHSSLIIGLLGITHLSLGFLGSLPGVPLLCLRPARISSFEIICCLLLITGSLIEIIIGLTTVAICFLLIVFGLPGISLSLLSVVVILSKTGGVCHQDGE